MLIRKSLYVIPIWVFLVALSNTCTTCCQAVLQGDEQFADKDGGRFWAFHSAGVSVVNADSCRVEHDFRTDRSGQPLPDSWSDGVYMESTGSDTSGKGYILINSGVTRYDDTDQAKGEIIVFATDPKHYGGKGPFQTRLTTEGGGRHDHSYGIYTRNEYWTEVNGKVYIIHLGDLDKLQQRPAAGDSSYVPAEITLNIDDSTQLGQSDGINGQMLWDESPHLSKHGYVTSRYKAIHIVDLETKTQVGLFNYSSFLDEGECSWGAHGIAYSDTNKHLYVECTWDGPTLEFDLQNPTEPVFVAKHNVSGWLNEDPVLGLVVATDRNRNQVHMFIPARNGQVSSIEYQVDVPGHPDMPSFFQKSSFETVVCMPLTENVNRNNLDAAGNVACDQYACGPPQTPTDVAAGMCLYDATDNNMTLLRVRLEDYDSVVNETDPYGNRCPRCKIRDSYRGGDICTCTPHCGSCASPDYDATRSGVRCFTLESAVDGVKMESTLIKGAGAIVQEGPSFWQAQCSYSWTHRSSKRGGRYHVSVAHFPSNSLQIVDMYTQQLKCQVDLPGKPDRVVYVPPQPNQVRSYAVEERAAATRAGSITLIILGCVASVVLLLLVLQYGTRSSSSSSPNWNFEDAHSGPSDHLELSPPAVEQHTLPAIS